ncbi:hypothetical protein CAAN1_21S02432 [[Candida] anglica]|uniref:Uncharacterized protein n=1 Tax=[Candida] anglica TaxID=148631 RepID=A0ABP0EE24_9ASCO
MYARSIGIRLPRSGFSIPRSFHQSTSLLKAPRTGYNSADSTVNTDDILTENNPWSPTLYEDKVYIHHKRSLRSVALPSNYRLSYQPLYEAPAAKYVGILKRITLSFAVLGAYGAKLFYDSPHFDDIYAALVFGSCMVPALIVEHKTQHYVTRIFRLYNKDKPQTLENLLEDESLIMEKLNWTGGKTFNHLLKISNNDTLKLEGPPKHPLTAQYSTWRDIDPHSGVPRQYYVADNVGGLKMDRLWGIVEHNSSVDNGRYMEPPKSE